MVKVLRSWIGTWKSQSEKIRTKLSAVTVIELAISLTVSGIHMVKKADTISLNYRVEVRLTNSTKTSRSIILTLNARLFFIT